jgi:DNA processing protein
MKVSFDAHGGWSGPEPERDRACLAALAWLPEMTPRRLAVVLRAHPPAEAWDRVVRGWVPGSLRPSDDLPSLSARWRAHAARHPPEAVADALASGGVEIVWPVADGYGERFMGVDPPVSVLFAVGRLELLAAPTIAMVGTRRSTSLGREVARTLGRELASMGVVVGSGLALGIDAAAHTGALAALDGAGPMAVVGTGVDVVYPRANASLWASVAERGLVISEHPPGTAAQAHHFPQRNRVLAALAAAVVVVESHRRGGALITAALAADLGRPVGAVPGSVRNPAAEGANLLLRDGAGVVLEALDALAVAGLVPPKPPSGLPAWWSPPAAPPSLSGPEQLVLDVLGDGATVDELVGRSGATLTGVMAALDRLDERGLVAPDGPRWRRTGRDRA